MQMKTGPILRVLVAFVFVLTASGNAGGGEVRQLLVDHATTAEEHAASAEFYREKARDQRIEAVRHREMGARYGQGSMGERGKQQEHCNRIASLHERMAEEYEALGRNHQSEAEKLGEDGTAD
jgi:hypothetical protein